MSQTIQEIAEKNHVLNFGQGYKLNKSSIYWNVPEMSGFKILCFIDYPDELVTKLASNNPPLSILEFFDMLILACSGYSGSVTFCVSQFLVEKINHGYFEEHIGCIFYKLHFPNDIINIISSFMENPNRFSIPACYKQCRLEYHSRPNITVQNVDKLLKYFSLTIQTKKIMPQVSNFPIICDALVEKIHEKYISSIEICPFLENRKVHKVVFLDPPLVHNVKSIEIKIQNILGESTSYNFKKSHHDIWECCFSTIENILNKDGEIMTLSQFQQYNPLYVDNFRDRLTIKIEWTGALNLINFNNSLQICFICEQV